MTRIAAKPSLASDASVRPAPESKTERAVALKAAAVPPAVDEFRECEPVLGNELIVPPGEAGIVPNAPAYLSAFAEMREQLYGFEKQYPKLAKVTDIGDSWEKTQGKSDRDILALTLTNVESAKPKPKLLLMGGLHARETANPELLLRWAKQTLERYGTDPEATALLDNYEVTIIVCANPDGHAVVEQGYETGNSRQRMQRKNTQGIDLNRAFDYKWGYSGTSTNPGSDTYGGPHAAAAPEVQAIQAFMKDYAPNAFYDFHSYGPCILYPWGYADVPCPDDADFKAAASRFSKITNYRPMQAADLYPASGASDDYAYGELGIPSMTFETGTGFLMDQAGFDKTWKAVEPLIGYLVKTSGDVFGLTKGPDAQAIEVTPDGQVMATVTDAAAGGQAIVKAELVFDPATPPGQGIPLQAADGAFDAVAEKVAGQLPGFTSQEAGGSREAGGPGRLVYVRGMDAQGNWGPATAQWIKSPA